MFCRHRFTKIGYSRTISQGQFIPAGGNAFLVPTHRSFDAIVTTLIMTIPFRFIESSTLNPRAVTGSPMPGSNHVPHRLAVLVLSVHSLRA